MPPFNGSGGFVVYTPGNPRVAGTTIAVTAINNTNTDFATGLTNAVTRDGQGQMGANFVPATSATYDIGSTSVKWKRGYFSGLLSTGGSVVFQGGTFATTLTGAAVANNSVQLPASGSGILALTSQLSTDVAQVAFTGTSTMDLFTSTTVFYTMMVIQFEELGLDANDDILIQASDSITGFLTAGYNTYCNFQTNAGNSFVSSINGFIINASSGTTVSGAIILTRSKAPVAGADTWMITGSIHRTGATGGHSFFGSKTLTNLADMDGLRLVSTLGANFSTGRVTVLGFGNG